MEEDYKRFKKEIEKSYSKIWGPRCDVYDLDEWPELKKKKNEKERCPTCQAYDRMDEFLADLKKLL